MSRYAFGRKVESGTSEFGKISNDIAQGLGKGAGDLTSFTFTSLGKGARSADLPTVGKVLDEVGAIGGSLGTAAGQILGVSIDVAFKATGLLAGALIRFGKTEADPE
jgi:hypothetical protein